MLDIKYIRFFIIIFLLFNVSILKADPKRNIILNINETESLKFDFIRIVNENEERGICYLKRPYYLKCEYKDKNQKELIVNKKRLVIYHKRYNKIYNYPLSKSYFTEILSKDKFSEMIDFGKLKKENNSLIIESSLKDRGKIIFYFNSNDYILNGWDLVSLNDNMVSFKIFNSKKNYNIEENIFDIPNIN